MDPCEDRYPRVIDDNFIQKMLLEQTPKGEAGRLARLEGVPSHEAQEIRMEYKNILKIDHLWVLKNLKRLVLNNNLIAEIEGLESLVHLTDLDLSFNKIETIEGLDQLVKLEKLSFFGNLITTINNMDNLKYLTILSIGRNRISDWNKVLYLRRFENLRSLNMAENPCASEENFQLYIALFLPQLVYSEYRLIKPLEKELGAEIFHQQYTIMEGIEAVEKGIRMAKEKEEGDAVRHAKGFVEYLNSNKLFNMFFEEDPDGLLLLDIGDEMKEYHVVLEEQIFSECKDIFHFGEAQYQIRQTEVDLFMNTVETAKAESQKKSIECMEKYLQKKIEIFASIREKQEQLDTMSIDLEGYNEHVDVIAVEFEDILHHTWKVLMKLEIEMFEQISEVNETFEITVTELINTFIETAQGLFTHMRDYEGEYSELVADCTNRFLTNVTLQTVQVPESLKNIMCDKDILSNVLGASHDTHLQLIDQREDQLITNAKTWLENLVNDLQTNEVNRNRDKVTEVNKFLDVQRDEFIQLVNEVFDNLNPDIAGSLI